MLLKSKFYQVIGRELHLNVFAVQVQRMSQAFGTAHTIAQPPIPLQTAPVLGDVSTTLSSLSQSFTAISGSNTTALTTFSTSIILLLCAGHWAERDTL